MRFPPLRLHYYGIRLRLCFSLLVLIITGLVPFIFKKYEADVFSIIILELIVINFTLGYHEYHTTSKSYLSLRNHRRYFFISSLAFGFAFSLITAGLTNAYYYVYQTSLGGVSNVLEIIIFPTLIYYIIYLLGNSFALIFKSRRLIWSSIGTLILLVSLFYKNIWENRYFLQSFLFLPLMADPNMNFYILALDVASYIIIILIINFLIFRKTVK